MSDSQSQQLMEAARQVIPGGVNSPVRAFRAVGGEPVFIERARGSKIYGADGTEYIDFVGSWGPAILGHADPDVVRAVTEAAANGLSFGAPTAREVDFAQAVLDRYPSIEMMRCVSSGTEATMSALRAARGHTGRSVIVKFDGAYHGHAEALLVQAGSGAATFGNPDSAGVPASMVEHTATLGYNDTAALEALFKARGADIAAVIVEPVSGNMGCIAPEPGFLEAIVRLCETAGSVAIFDEVMTGCRLARGGAQELYGIQPHMTCLGKVVGGGMPLAVYGGRREIMSKIAPLGPIYQAGTLSGNPLATAAGLATLQKLDAAAYSTLERTGARLEAGLNAAIAETGAQAVVQRVGAMLTLFFSATPVKNWVDSQASDKERFGKWFGGLLKRGVYWPPSGFEAAFISVAHSDEDIERTVAAATESLRDMA